MAEVKVKTVTYDNLPEENKKDPKILPFRYQKPFLQEIEEYEQEKEVSAPNGPPFMFEEFLDAVKDGFKGTYEDYLNVIDRSPQDYAKKKEGIMGVASAKDDRDYLKMILSRYYTPNELFGKTIRELNKLLELHINIQGGLIR